MALFHPNCGEVAERLNAPHSKCGIRATVSGVRIPPSPPQRWLIEVLSLDLRYPLKDSGLLGVFRVYLCT